MKSIFFHFQGYRDLPDDFVQKNESIWVKPSTDQFCDPQTSAKYARWNIEELELADELGFDGLGINEHHSNGYGYCNSPNLIAAILARRKSDAALVVLGNTLPLYSPAIRTAEEFAMLDGISGGRLVAGFPVGSAMDTVGAYSTPPTHVRPRYWEAHDLITQAWTRTDTPFAFNGKYNKLRYVNIWPKPIQKPHPPIWLAGGGSIETWKYATDHNYTYSYLSFSGHKAGKTLMDGYWQQVEKAGLDDNPFRAGFAQVVVVADSDAEAEKLYLPHIRNFYSKALHVPSHMANPPGFMSKESYEFNVRKVARHAALLGDPSKATWADFTEKHKMVIGGSPERVAAELKEAARNLRVGHMMVLLQIQSMETELTRYNIRMYAEKVLPQLQGLWEKEGYKDHWWPQGATRNQFIGGVAK
jgi:alkanesulfonate monooxygenase SsuD/methylene tetrahydromethanopterin reductase-like flavin-dependent oxidoreductase (luciferase family)